MAELIFPNGKYPTVTVAYDYILRAAYVNGHIHLKTHQKGDRFLRHVEERAFRDGNGKLVQVEDHPFALWIDGDSMVGWHLMVRVAGESGLSQWVTYDDGETWERISRPMLDRIEADLRGGAPLTVAR